MTDKTSNDSRRKLLKSIAAGSGAVVAGKSLPESWSKPVVNAVMLPAHAATTEATTTPTPLPTSYSGGLTFGVKKVQNGPLNNVLSVLVQDAHADSTPATGGSMCIDTSNAPMFTAKVLVSRVLLSKALVSNGEEEYSDYFEGTGTIGSAAGVNLDHKIGCDSFGTVNVAILSNDANGAAYKVTVNNGIQVDIGTVRRGSVCPKEPVGCR